MGNKNTTCYLIVILVLLLSAFFPVLVLYAEEIGFDYLKVGDLTTNNSKQVIQPEMVKISGGCFDMGDLFGEGWQLELKLQPICVGSFQMSASEVTQGEWKEIMNWNPSFFNECGDDCPVENISWYDTQFYISLLNRRTGMKYRLPTEIEWEFAAREKGKKVRFGTGKNTIGDDEANFDARAIKMERYSRSGGFVEKTLPVKSFPPNSLGLYDMAGNVWEFVTNEFSKEFLNIEMLQKAGFPANVEFIITRGGGWSEQPKNIRASRRSKVEPHYRNSNLGFRLVKDF